jgi:hypothetical protein
MLELRFWLLHVGTLEMCVGGGGVLDFNKLEQCRTTKHRPLVACLFNRKQEVV